MSRQTKLSESDFIIPDEESPMQAPRTAPAPRSTGQQEPQPPRQSQPAAAGFPWAPAVDLSQTFAPFVTSKTFQNSNKVSERRFNGGDTLDEPVTETLRRDFSQIGRRVWVVLWPAQLQSAARAHQAQIVALAERTGVRLPESVAASARPVATEDDDSGTPETSPSLDWDLWGPLIFSLVYAVTMGVSAPNSQANVVFSGTFSFTWLFFLVVGLNIQLLGGTISFLSAISSTGYSMFPIVVGGLVSTLLLRWRLARLVLMSICALWSVYAASMNLKCSGVLPGRVVLALYPVALLYGVLSWLVVIT